MIIPEAIYALLTIVIPLSQSYKAVRSKSEGRGRLWAIYWAMLYMIHYLQLHLPILSSPPFKLLFLLFSIWLYNLKYQGAFVVADACTGFISESQWAQRMLQTFRIGLPQQESISKKTT